MLIICEFLFKEKVKNFRDRFFPEIEIKLEHKSMYFNI